MLEEILISMYCDLIKLAIPLYAGINIASMTGRYARLFKLSRYDNALLSSTPPEVDKSCIILSKHITLNLNKEVREDLECTIDQLKRKVNTKNLQTLYNNLDTMDIKKVPSMNLMSLRGTYNARTNSLKYAKVSSLGHEMLHSASSYYDRISEIVFMGFTQMNLSTRIGRGLTEGYTELEKSKIFNTSVNSYFWLVNIAKLIELFFDEPKELESLYFQMNLPGLINHLEKYATTEEIINLIVDIDRIDDLDQHFNPLRTLSYVRVQLELYKWFCATNKSNSKHQAFIDVLCKDNLIKTLMNNKMYVTYCENYKKNWTNKKQIR